MTAPSEATATEVGLFLDGTRCSGCVRRIERALQDVPGVIEAAVNYTTRRAMVRYASQAVSVEELVARIEQLGYGATPFDPSLLGRSAAETRSARDALVRVLVAAFLAGNVMLIAFGLYFGENGSMDPTTRRVLRWLAIALTTPSVVWCALPFWRGAFAGLRQRTLTMDIPVVLGISVAFTVHILGTLAETPQLFVDSAATIVFLILLGRALERGARARASGAVDRLTAIAPENVLRRTREGGVEPVSPRELQVGDRIVVPAGQVIPVDGMLRSGDTEVDEALLSGESMPVLRRRGELVSAGSRNCLLEIEVEVSARVEAGTLAKLAALLERAQTDRPRVQQLADRVAAVFAPTVLTIAAATAVFWIWQGAGALDVALRAATVLIVACPCALGLATPTAITAAIGRAAELGILVKRGDALEHWARVDHILLDKTGTLTEGVLRVDTCRVAPGHDERGVIESAVRAEGRSTHPVAVALRSEAEARGIELEGLPALQHQTVPGRGVEASNESERILVGSFRMLEEAGLQVEEKLSAAGAELLENGLTVVWVARGNEVIGVLGLADQPRADAREAISRLRGLGASVALVSGDEPAPVELARERSGLAVTEAHAAVSPEEKVEFVREARGRGARVLAAGDGINDAAALALADVGVAMGRGADVTLHAADIVIRSPRLGALADGALLSRSCYRRIRENLGFALCYNLVAVPLAMAGILDPLSAAIAMSLSSLVVTGNAARLLRWRAPA